VIPFSQGIVDSGEALRPPPPPPLGHRDRLTGADIRHFSSAAMVDQLAPFTRFWPTSPRPPRPTLQFRHNAWVPLLSAPLEPGSR